MVGNTDPDIEHTFVGVKAQNNILLRWLGVRLVPHLPCSFRCAGTTALGDRFAGLLEGSDELRWMTELLEARVEWSANKGIAEIALPILKVSTKTDALPRKVIVRLSGKDVEAQSKGNAFPWTVINAAPSITPMTFHKKEPMPTTLWEHNGFSSREAMLKSHTVVQDFYRQYLVPDLRLLDLGCGNGLLAASLSERAEGVESDPTRASSAANRLLRVYQMSIINFMRSFPVHETYDVALISAERLKEMAEVDRNYTLAWLKRCCVVTIIYTYSDGDLSAICCEYKFQCRESIAKDGVQVALLAV
jgi:hypothetical protein